MAQTREFGCTSRPWGFTPNYFVALRFNDFAFIMIMWFLCLLKPVHSFSILRPGRIVFYRWYESTNWISWYFSHKLAATLNIQLQPMLDLQKPSLRNWKTGNGYRQMFVDVITGTQSQKQWFNCARSKGMMADNGVVNLTLIEYLWQNYRENVRRPTRARHYGKPFNKLE